MSIEAMKKTSCSLLLCLATSAIQAETVPGISPLLPATLENIKLDSVPPFPDEAVLKGKSENWLTVLHQGELMVAIYESTPAMISIADPYPYDEFVQVLQGQVTLTHADGSEQTYRVGDNFLVPKGWMGTWDMTEHYRELIIIEARAWEKVGMP